MHTQSTADPAPAAQEASLVRLFQLTSPSLPVGGFSYSQGLEYAVENGWVHDAESFAAWLDSIASDSLAGLEIPVLARLLDAIHAGDPGEFTWWVDLLFASRETRELREEERSRGRAMFQVLSALEVPVEADFADTVKRCQLAGFAWAVARWKIPIDRLALAYAYAWLDNGVTAGIKLIPLGQSSGQRLLARLGATLPARVLEAAEVADDRIGGSTPALAIASSLHETQYTRLFRS